MPKFRRTDRMQTTFQGLNPARPAVTLMCLSLAMWAQDPADARKLYAESAKSVLLLVVKSDTGQLIGQGSGFVIAGGKVLTNEHVARGGTVMLDLGAVKIPAIVDRVDTENDLALLSTSAELAARALPLAKDTPLPGTPIFAIGNPAGLEQSISNGVVSANRNWNGRQLLQITAPISPGSSGGPILNKAGEVVGVAVGVLEKGQNINFAVPVSVIHGWLNGNELRVEDAEAILKRVDSLIAERDQLTYSADAGSPWMRLDSRVDVLLQQAVDKAGQDSALLYKIAWLSENQNIDIAILAAERAKRQKATMEILLRARMIRQ
jgi:hypothetical protein